MKNIQRIDEAVGSIEERRVSAEALLKSVVKGDSSEVEGIKLSKEMADSFLMWLQYSTYGKKFSALPFYKLFSASFNWGLDRYTKSAALKKEYKELKAKASEMRKAEKFESLKEAIDLLKSSWRGTKGWNDIARIMDAGLMKAIKSGSVTLGYAKDYVKSLERMAKRNAKKFFAEYGNFTEEDFIEDVEYNMANENKVNEAKFKKGQYIKSKNDSDDFDGDVYDRTNDVDGSEILKNSSFEIYEIGKDEVVLWSDADGVEYSIDPDDLKHFVKESVINEAKKLGLGDKGVDYNDNVVEVIEIGKFDKVAKRFKKEMKADAEDYGFEKGAGEFYLTKNIEATEGNVGDLAIYPVKYDMSNYWGLDPLKESINEAKFSFSEDEVKDVAEVIAKALAKMDNMKTAVHDMEYDAGRGAGFEISMGGDKYEGGSYVVKPNGDVVNAAIGNSFPNAVYANIGDTDIKKVMKKIKKFESVTEAEDFKPHMMYDPETGEEYKAEKPEDHERMAKLGYVHEKPEIKENNMKHFKSYGSFINEEYDTEARKEMAAKGFALADGSFPIANLEDLKNAIMAYGRAKDQAKAAKFIAKRAKALGAEDLIPDSDDFQKSLKEGIEDVYTQVPSKTIAIEEGKDIGSWNQGGLKGDKNVLITTFVGPKDIEDFGLGRKCMQINIGMDYISLNPADIVELKDILKSYKVK